jgi:hypothetical protein
MSFFGDIFKTKVTYTSPSIGGGVGATPPVPFHQEFAASSPALTPNAPKGTSASINVPVPTNAKHFRVSLGVVQVDQGVPTATTGSGGSGGGSTPPSSSFIPDPLFAFGAVPLGMLEDSLGDLGTVQIQLAGNVFVPINVPANRSIRVTVVWGLTTGAQGAGIPANAVKVPVFVDFD